MCVAFYKLFLGLYFKKVGKKERIVSSVMLSTVLALFLFEKHP